ncbi:hypothetical protein LXL04_026001 [Taraxacum kok-saghyz]
MRPPPSHHRELKPSLFVLLCWCGSKSDGDREIPSEIEEADFDSKTDGTRLLTVIIKTIFMLICFTGSKSDFSVDFNSCCSVAVAVLLPKIVIPSAYLSKCFS